MSRLSGVVEIRKGIRLGSLEIEDWVMLCAMER